MLSHEDKKENAAKINTFLFNTVENWMTGLRKNTDGTYNCINPERQDSDPSSMMLYPDGHAWDFAAQKRYSMVDLKALVTNSDPKQIFKEVGHHLGIFDGRKGASAGKTSASVIPLNNKSLVQLEGYKEPNIPSRTPTDAEFKAKIDGEYRAPSKAWAYRNKNGLVVGYARRFETVDSNGNPDKTFRPLSWIIDQNGNGRWIGTIEGFNGCTPIYGAELLDSRRSARVLIVEGEKTADAARQIFPEMVVITFFGGAGKASKCDWSCLLGRDVVMWPDADQAVYKTGSKAGELMPEHEQASMKAMIAVAKQLESLGTSSLIVRPPVGVRPKWDLADIEETGFTATDARTHLASEAINYKAILPPEPAPAKAEPLTASDEAPARIKTEEVVTMIRQAFDRALKAENLFDEFPFAKNHYFYTPKADENSKRKVPTFIACVAESGLVSIVPEHRFIDNFIRWYDDEGRFKFGGVCLHENTLISLAKRLAERLPKLMEPKLFKWQGKPGNAWNVLKFNISSAYFDDLGFDGTEANAMKILEKIAPPWFEQFSRMSNRLGVLCYFGALIDPGARPQQYLWMFGEGNDGKSSVLQVLENLFGSAAIKTEWPDQADKFFTSRMESRRVVLLDDQNHGHVVRSGLWKMITGSKTILIEHKGQAPYVIDNEVLIVSASNHRPEILAELSNTRRLILSECQSFSKDSIIMDYERVLMQYADPFFSLCFALWQAHKGQKGLAPVDGEVTDDNILEVYAAESDFIEANFELFDPGKIQAALASDLQKKLIPHISNADLRMIADRHKMDFQRLSDFLVRVLKLPAQQIAYSKRDKRRVIFGAIPNQKMREKLGMENMTFERI
jgi:hypothetical protein